MNGSYPNDKYHAYCTIESFEYFVPSRKRKARKFSKPCKHSAHSIHSNILFLLANVGASCVQNWLQERFCDLIDLIVKILLEINFALGQFCLRLVFPCASFLWTTYKRNVLYVSCFRFTCIVPKCNETIKIFLSHLRELQKVTKNTSSCF